MPQYYKDITNTNITDILVRLLDEKLLLIEAERRLNTAKLALDYSEIKSSINGTVSQVVAKNIGQVVNTGANLVEIVPENADLRLKVLIQTKDIASVRPNLKAKIAFTSFDMAVYGQFDGIVKTVSASSSIQNEDGIPYYIAIVEVDKNEINSISEPLLVATEHIDEPREEKKIEIQGDLFDERGRQLKGWTNKLIWGNNSLVLSSLINGPLRKEIEEQGGLKQAIKLMVTNMWEKLKMNSQTAGVN